MFCVAVSNVIRGTSQVIWINPYFSKQRLIPVESEQNTSQCSFKTLTRNAIMAEPRIQKCRFSNSYVKNHMVGVHYLIFFFRGRRKLIPAMGLILFMKEYSSWDLNVENICKLLRQVLCFCKEIWLLKFGPNLFFLTKIPVVWRGTRIEPGGSHAVNWVK